MRFYDEDMPNRHVYQLDDIPLSFGGIQDIVIVARLVNCLEIISTTSHHLLRSQISSSITLIYLAHEGKDFPVVPGLRINTVEAF